MVGTRVRIHTVTIFQLKQQAWYCNVFPFLHQFFEFWASYVLRLETHRFVLMFSYLQSSIFHSLDYWDLVSCISIEISELSFLQILSLLAVFSLHQISILTYHQVVDWRICYLCFLVLHCVEGLSCFFT